MIDFNDFWHLFDNFQVSRLAFKMFQREHTIFIIKSYYSNGNRGENGDWIYSPRLTSSVRD
jgi:hypothetical protein